MRFSTYTHWLLIFHFAARRKTFVQPRHSVITWQACITHENDDVYFPTKIDYRPCPLRKVCVILLEYKSWFSSLCARMTITYINLTWPHTLNLFLRFQYFRQSFISVQCHTVPSAFGQRQILYDPKAKVRCCSRILANFGVAANTWSIIHPSARQHAIRTVFSECAHTAYTRRPDYYTRSLWFARSFIAIQTHINHNNYSLLGINSKRRAHSQSDAELIKLNSHSTWNGPWHSTARTHSQNLCIEHGRLLLNQKPQPHPSRVTRHYQFAFCSPTN